MQRPMTDAAQESPAARLPGLAIVAHTHPGRVRGQNQDAVGTAARMGVPARLVQERGELLAVADGMGGHAGGEVASRLAVDTLFRTYYQAPLGDAAAALGRAVEQANAAVHARSVAEPEAQGMGTTLVAAVVRGRRLVVANVGDSRAYLLRGGRLRQISRDHSWVAESLAAGLIDETQARHHVHRNLVTRSLGPSAGVEVDVFQETLQPGDVILLCSDGLTNEADEATIAATLAHDPPAAAAAGLLDLANSHGGRDNVSVVVARVSVPSPQPRRPLLPVGLLASGLAVMMLAVLAALWWRGSGGSLPVFVPPVSSATTQPLTTAAGGMAAPSATPGPDTIVGATITAPPTSPTAPRTPSPLLTATMAGPNSPLPTATPSPSPSLWAAPTWTATTSAPLLPDGPPSGPVLVPLEWAKDRIDLLRKLGDPRYRHVKQLGYSSRKHDRGHAAEVLDGTVWRDENGYHLLLAPAPLSCLFGVANDTLGAQGPIAAGFSFVLEQGDGQETILVPGPSDAEYDLQPGYPVMVLGRPGARGFKAVAMIGWRGEDGRQQQILLAPPGANGGYKAHVWFYARGCEQSPDLQDYRLDNGHYLVYSIWDNAKAEIPAMVADISKSSGPANPAVFHWDDENRVYRYETQETQGEP